MKVLIVSDSHGYRDELEAVKTRLKNKVDAMIHCGDSEETITSDIIADFFIVRGNCDFEKNFLEDQLVEFEGIQIYVTHGHLYNVKMSLLNLRYRAEEVGAKIVCFGHSHIAGAECIDGILFINPGSIKLPRLRKEKTYAILEIGENKDCTVRFYNVEGFEIKELMVACKIG